MEPLKLIMEALQPGEFLNSLALNKAQLHVSVLPSHWCYFQLCMKNTHAQFRALPFSLSTAPRVSTKVLVDPISFLRQQRVYVHPFLDLLVHSLSEIKAGNDLHATRAYRTMGY